MSFYCVFLLHFYAWCEELWVALLLKCAVEINLPCLAIDVLSFTVGLYAALLFSSFQGGFCFGTLRVSTKILNNVWTDEPCLYFATGTRCNVKLSSAFNSSWFILPRVRTGVVGSRQAPVDHLPWCCHWSGDGLLPVFLGVISGGGNPGRTVRTC